MAPSQLVPSCGGGGGDGVDVRVADGADDAGGDMARTWGSPLRSWRARRGRPAALDSQSVAGVTQTIVTIEGRSSYPV